MEPNSKNVWGLRMSLLDCANADHTLLFRECFLEKITRVGRLGGRCDSVGVRL